MVAQPGLSARSHINTADLKGRVDCRLIARAYLGEPKHSTSKYDTYIAPRGERTGSFQVYADGFKDFGDGEQHGDHIELIKLLYSQAHDFKSALLILASFAGGNALPTPRIVQRPAVNEPPSATWQTSARTLIASGVAQLWSPSGAAALAWLRGRGYSDDTIWAAQLGYNPAWQKTDILKADGIPARLAPGIIIPCVAADAVWYVQIRARVGTLAAALGIADDTIKGEVSSKFLHLSGGKPTLYNVDDLKADRPVFFMESQLDALLMHQEAGDLASFVALGGTSGRLPTTYKATVAAAPLTGLIRDNDTAGQRYADRNGAGLPAGHHVIAVPHGKDPTDFKQAGGDVRGWFESAISELTLISRNQETDTDPGLAIGLYREYVASIDNRLTFGAFSLIRNTYPKGAALVAFLAARIGQFKSGGQVNRLLLQAAAVALGWKISRQTIDNGLAALCKGGMCKKLDPVLADHSNTGSKILPTYQIDLNTGFTEAKERAIYRTWETANPAHPDAPLGKLRSELISDPVAHDAIDRALRTTYASDQSGKGERRAKRLLQSMKARLDDQRVFDLDFKAPISNEADLVIAYAHALAKADAATQADGKAHISLERWADLLGVSRATAGKIQAALGVVEADITPVILTSVAQVAAAGREHKGRITGIVRIDAHENRDVIRLGDPKYAARAVKVALDAGYRVEAQIQRANKILPFERPVIAHKERIVKPPDPDLVSNAKSTPREIAPEVEKPYRFRAYSPRRYRGSGYNPDYKLAYAAQILSRLDYHAGANQRALDSRGRLVYRASGKIILLQPIIADLYALAPHDPTYTDENEDQLMYTEKELVEPIQRQLSQHSAQRIIVNIQPDTDLAFIDAQLWFAAPNGSTDRDRIADRVIERGGAYRVRFNEYVSYLRNGGTA